MNNSSKGLREGEGVGFGVGVVRGSISENPDVSMLSSSPSSNRINPYVFNGRPASSSISVPITTHERNMDSESPQTAVAEVRTIATS